MKIWLRTLAWKLSVAFGLIAPPRLQPIPIHSDEQRRLVKQRRR
ncbi:PA1414 family protein [Pseudomonas sp. 2FE]|nr:PA1414 family protein [Pseudomonas sp. 2FE]